MQAGKLRFRAEIEQYDGTAWQPYFAGYFDIATVSEGESVTAYQLSGRWAPQWDQMAGLATLDKGYRLVWTYGEKDGVPLVHYLMIEQIIDPDNRRREIQLICRKIGDN